MGKLVLISFLTLDGVLQSPGAKDEDLEGGFQYGGWQLPYFEDADTTVSDRLHHAGAMLIGRKTYDIFAGYWPTTGRDVDQFGDLMNKLPKYVASTTLQKTEWENSNLIKGDIREGVEKVKKEIDKDIIIFGSGNFCQTLMKLNLIDEYILFIHPLVLGTGKKLFEDDVAKLNLEFVSSKSSKNGVVEINYKIGSSHGSLR